MKCRISPKFQIPNSKFQCSKFQIPMLFCPPAPPPPPQKTGIYYDPKTNVRLFVVSVVNCTYRAMLTDHTCSCRTMLTDHTCSCCTMLTDHTCSCRAMLTDHTTIKTYALNIWVVFFALKFTVSRVALWRTNINASQRNLKQHPQIVKIITVLSFA